MRLKSSYDISGFSSQMQVILTAMKKYGLILADNGSALYVTGVSDSRWGSDLDSLKTVPASAAHVSSGASVTLSWTVSDASSRDCVSRRGRGAGYQRGWESDGDHHISCTRPISMGGPSATVTVNVP
ncbi:MAG TPA: hypothetical protein VFE61_04540 [Candidatus Sulfotelmatobacter sp.]|nr:hypothetical protein [Candidatus Sulfotelmatobacter sp.]